MTPTPGIVTSQEKIAGALSYLFFFIPSMMDMKTEFTQFHARQAFVCNLICILAVFIGFIPWVGLFFRWLVFVALFVIGGWSAYQAYLGNRFVAPWIGENANMIIAKLGVANMFQI